MADIIFTTRDELCSIIREIVETSIANNQTKGVDPPDTITLSDTVDLLSKNGFPTSKAKIYKLTSANKVPHRKYGNKLVFSRKEMLAWAISHTKSKPDNLDSVHYIAHLARKR